MRNNIKSIKRIFDQLLYILTPEQKKGAILVLVFMIISSGLELLGVSAIYPFLQMMLESDELKKKWYVHWIYIINPDITTQNVLLILGVLIMLIYIFKNIFMIISAYVQNSYAAKCQREISVFMLEAYMKRPYQFFLNTNSGDIYRGISSDITGVYQILLYLFSMIMEIITILCLGIYLVVTDYVMALGAIMLAGICFMAIVIGFKGRMKEAGKCARDAAGLANKYGYQAINGIKEISVLGRRENFVKQYSEAAFVQQRSAMINGFITACPDRILEGVCISGFIGIACIRISFGTDIDTFIPVLGTFAMAAFKILPSISKVSSRINSLIYFQSSLQGVYDNLKESQEYERTLSEYILPYEHNMRHEDERCHRFHNQLCIRDVSWKYQNTTERILNHINLEIKKGEAVALIGASGAGKTTLADIIMGLFKPQEGMITMDGIDIFTIPGQWTKIIGYVPQSVFLIDDTVRCNVAFGLDRENISDEKVWKALEQAQLRDFVEKLSHGLGTIVGERGVKFSGGQRQRIAIARALYENPDILVLDEATSALDNETETAVMESIEALQGSKTLIIVAHRLTTIRNCDVIYEIRDGKAVKRNKDEVLAGV